MRHISALYSSAPDCGLLPQDRAAFSGAIDTFETVQTTIENIENTFSTPKQLFYYLTGQEPFGHIKVNYDLTVHITTYHDRDFALLYRGTAQNAPISEDEIKKTSRTLGASISHRKVPNLLGFLTIQKNTYDISEMRVTRKHEEQHALYNLFSYYLQRQDQQARKKRLARYIENQLDDMDMNNISEDEAGSKIASKIAQYLVYARGSAEKLKDELLTRLHDGETVFAIRDVMHDPYIVQEKVSTQAALDFSKNIFSQKPRWRTAASRSKFLSSPSLQYLSVNCDIELHSIVDTGCKAADMLLRYGYTHEEVWQHLAPYPIKEWPAVVRRIQTNEPPNILTKKGVRG